MSNTKWDELRLGMYGLEEFTPQRRTKDLESGYLSPWDLECFHHFRCGGYETIEWVEIKITSPEQEAAVLEVLRKVHVPGEKTADGFKVYGYVPPSVAVNYV